MCVREERAKELFYKRKNKNPKKPKPQTRDSHKNKKRHTKKKKAYAITFPASHAPKLPPIPSHIPLNQPTLSTRKKRRKYSVLNLTQQKTLKTTQKRNQKKSSRTLYFAFRLPTHSLSLTLLLFPSLSQASVDIFGSFFPMRKGRAQTKTTQKRLKVESWTTLIMFFQLKV